MYAEVPGHRSRADSLAHRNTIAYSGRRTGRIWTELLANSNFLAVQ
jgi:hypothetical protein